LHPVYKKEQANIKVCHKTIIRAQVESALALISLIDWNKDEKIFCEYCSNTKNKIGKDKE